METAIEQLSNGNTITYTRLDNGTCYQINTPSQIVDILERAREYHTRLMIYLGDVATGQAWGDLEIGYIGRSTGRIQIPLVIYNNRSMGGGALLDDCIVKIEFANKKFRGRYPIYIHPTYTPTEFYNKSAS